MSQEHIEIVDHGEGHGMHIGHTLVCEISWEVCQQVGGIYTVLIGPYNPETSPQEFEETPLRGVFGDAVKALRAAGLEVHYGYWLITGRPRAVLFNPVSAFNRLDEIKYFLWEHHGISMGNDWMLNQIAAFGYMVEQFFRALMSVCGNRRIIAHFHEWMSATAIPEMRQAKLPIPIVFTTHATLLGRYVANNDPWFYDHVPFVEWLNDARRYNIEAQVRIERAAAHGAHVFTTLSRITGFECEYLLGRKPDLLLPNGLNIERFAAVHEFQNLHRLYKEQIDQFVTGHFFPSYSFDLNHTRYFFTSGRYEYINKGFNLTIDALARLNWQMKETKLNKTIVFFLVTKQPFKSINADVLRNRAMMQEIQKTCAHIKEQVGERLFTATTMSKTISLDALLDDYWRLRLRRLMHEWRAKRPPTIVTHDMIDDANDEVLNHLRAKQLFNLPSDPVKVVYHPDFVASTDPLFGMDYDQFVRGCHLGVFPSAYEPWGYTPMECMARGVPAVTSDLAGFGTYLMDNMPDYEQRGLFVVKRRDCSFDAAVEQLTQWLFKFLLLDRRERIAMRNRVESSCDEFDWSNLEEYYELAHEMAMERAED
jgi:glycogen(starch) synthase